jgi:hypothetical protein
LKKLEETIGEEDREQMVALSTASGKLIVRTEELKREIRKLREELSEQQLLFLTEQLSQLQSLTEREVQEVMGEQTTTQ